MAYCGFHPYLDNTSDHTLLLPPAPLLHAQRTEGQACCARLQGSKIYERGSYLLCEHGELLSVGFFFCIPCLMILVKINSTRNQNVCIVFSVIEQDKYTVITRA